jgi:hypothetical protein
VGSQSVARTLFFVLYTLIALLFSHEVDGTRLANDSFFYKYDKNVPELKAMSSPSSGTLVSIC